MKKRKGTKRIIFISLISLMFLSVSGGGDSNTPQTQEVLITESHTSYAMERQDEEKQVMSVEIGPADMTVYELQEQNGRIAEQIEKADEIDKELEGIIEQLKKED